MKTFIVTSINQHGDRHYFYPKAKNTQDALKKGNEECMRISNMWNTYVTESAELFSMKKHTRD